MADDLSSLDYIPTPTNQYYSENPGGSGIPGLAVYQSPASAAQTGSGSYDFNAPDYAMTPPAAQAPEVSAPSADIPGTGALSGAASGLQGLLQKLGLYDPKVLSMLGLGGGLLGALGTGKTAAASRMTAPPLFGSSPQSSGTPKSPYNFVNYLQTPAARTPVAHVPISNYYTYGQGPEASFYGSAGHAQGGHVLGALSQHMANSISRHVKGPGDGTSDSIPAIIDGKQPARIANGEYILSADVVSHLGNGSNDAGAKNLDGFVSSVRKHKAGGMSKGKLPPDAKPIGAYMGAK